MTATTVNWKTMIPSLLFALNEACISMGIYHLSTSQLNSLDQLISALVVFAGVVYHHQKPITAKPTPVVTPEPTVTPDTTGHAPAAQ